MPPHALTVLPDKVTAISKYQTSAKLICWTSKMGSTLDSRRLLRVWSSAVSSKRPWNRSGRRTDLRAFSAKTQFSSKRTTKAQQSGSGSRSRRRCDRKRRSLICCSFNNAAKKLWAKCLRRRISTILILTRTLRIWLVRKRKVMAQPARIKKLILRQKTLTLFRETSAIKKTMKPSCRGVKFPRESLKMKCKPTLLSRKT